MKYIHYFVIIRLYSFQSFRWISFSYFTDFVSFHWISFSYFTDFVSFRWISFSYFTDFVSFRWISFSYFTDFVGFCFRFVSFLSLPVPNLEWELLKNVEIRKSNYARITHSIRGPPFREFCLFQEKSHIFSSENCTVY